MATKKLHKDPKPHAHLAETTPTPEQAKEMFAENPGLAYVVTTEGGMRRDGTLD